MTWISTWLIRGPGHTIPQYACHDTESQAEAHAAEIVRSQQARIATVYQAQTEEQK